MLWNDENKKHALEQLKFLLLDWINTNKPNSDIDENLFNKTCICILETVIIPKYEYKDGIEHIEWTSIDHEMINSCIDKFINKIPTQNKNIQDKNSSKQTQSNYLLYIFIVFLIIIILILFLSHYFKLEKTSDENIFNLDYE